MTVEEFINRDGDRVIRASIGEVQAADTYRRPEDRRETLERVLLACRERHRIVSAAFSRGSEEILRHKCL